MKKQIFKTKRAKVVTLMAITVVFVAAATVGTYAAVKYDVFNLKADDTSTKVVNGKEDIDSSEKEDVKTAETSKEESSQKETSKEETSRKEDSKGDSSVQTDQGKKDESKNSKDGGSSQSADSNSSKNSKPAEDSKPTEESSTPTTPKEESRTPVTPPKEESSTPTTPTKPAEESSTPSAPKEESSTPTTPTKPSEESSTPATPKEESKPVTPTEPTNPTTPTKPTEESSTPKEESSTPVTPPKEESSTTECQHVWQDITETIHHEATTELVPIYQMIEVVDEEEWDEVIGHDYYFKCSDGKEFHQNNYPSYDDCFDALLIYCTDYGCGYSNEDNPTYLHHDAITHLEQSDEIIGYEEKTIEAWDETVVVGRKCTKCGQTE